MGQFVDPYIGFDRGSMLDRSNDPDALDGFVVMANGQSVVASPVEDGWHPARLLPTVGLRSEQEKEARATSSLLAVMRAVPEFGRAVIGDLGGPRGRLTTYTEIQLKDSAGKVHIPDGAIIAERGKSLWRCLVEVKTGSAMLTGEQVNRYLDIGRGHGFDAVLTISNQITSSPRESPVSVDGRKRAGRVALFHLSWWRIITEAIVQHRHRGVSDPDQAWILGELIAYLDDENSGASGFQDMGDKWVSVRNGAANGTLRSGDSEVRDVVVRWDQFVDYLCLGLGQDLGGDVRPARPRKQAAEDRLAASAKRLEAEGKLEAAFRVPDAVGPVNLEADLRTRRVSTSVALDAPRTGRPLTRIHWILRQLKQAPGDLRIEVRFASARETSTALLMDARNEPERLLSSTDPKRNPRTFLLVLSRPLGTKRGKGEKSFVRDTRQQAVDFYRNLVQDLRAWQAPAPKLPEEPDEALPTPQPSPPPFSTEEREVGGAHPPRDDREHVPASTEREEAT